MEKFKSKYNSLKKWKKDFPVHYRDAISQGYVEELCERFGWDLPIIKERHPSGYWDVKENVLSEAKKYKTISEWKKKSSSSYGVARKNVWFDECTAHMIRCRVKNGYWNVKERCIEEAKKYKTVKEWQKNSNTSYNTARKNGWLDECTAHMIRCRVKKGYWQIKENVLSEAKKYKIVSEWKKKSGSSYYAARKNGWFDECTEYMVHKIKPKGYWDVKENVLSEAKKYNTITEWHKKSGSSCGAARKNGWFDECRDHMTRGKLKNGYWQIKENVLSEAKKYNTITEWHKKSSTSYKSSRKYDWFDECTAHMKKHRS